MEYLEIADAASCWNTSVSTVRRWCREGKVEGALQQGPGRRWRIPSDAVSPSIRKIRETLKTRYKF